MGSVKKSYITEDLATVIRSKEVSYPQGMVHSKYLVGCPRKACFDMQNNSHEEEDPYLYKWMCRFYASDDVEVLSQNERPASSGYSIMTNIDLIIRFCGEVFVLNMHRMPSIEEKPRIVHVALSVVSMHLFEIKQGLLFYYTDDDYAIHLVQPSEKDSDYVMNGMKNRSLLISQNIMRSKLPNGRAGIECASCLIRDECPQTEEVLQNE
jgi:hypothetical protein